MNNLSSPQWLGSIILIISLFGDLQAQDLHFSQFELNPLQQNPALAGIFKQDWRASVQYRSQWESVPVQYRTLAAAYDTKLMRRRSSLISAGLLLAQDQAGDAQLTWSQVGLQVSAAHAINKQQVIAIGFGVNMVQRTLDLSNLKFNNQWDGDQYNSGLPSKEQVRNSSGVKTSVQTGINWHYQRDNESRTFSDIGVGVAHLNQPEINFQTFAPQSLPVRTNLYVNSCFQNTEHTDIVVFGQVQTLKKAYELLLGGGIRYWISEETGVRFAAATRWKDAIIPSIQVTQRAWTVGVSYDINISSFKVATNRRGGFELVVVYTPQPVKPVRELKVCPIF